MLVPTGAEGKYEYDPSIPAGSGGGGGGGGSSDFSSAKVTFLNSAPTTYYEVATYGIFNDAVSTEILTVTFDGQEQTVEVPLYKGKAMIGMAGFRNVGPVLPTTTGGVELDLDNFCFVVTGDGTITCEGDGGGN